MAGVLGQLRCGRCACAFWAEAEAWNALMVVCPQCGARHANPDALPSRPPRVGHDELGAWINRYWIHPSVPVVGQILEVATGELHGFPYTVVIYGSPSAGIYLGACLIAVVTDVAPVIGLPWLTIALTQGGIVVEYGTDAGSKWRREQAMDAIDAMVRQLVSARAEPLHALVEIDRPSPLDPQQAERESRVANDPRSDSQLESQSVRCRVCGAPSSVACLVGDHARCPFCASPQELPPSLAQELALYQRRAHAALLRSHDTPPTDLARSREGGTALACVTCGAPNAHRVGALDERCTSCGAPLIPSSIAMQATVAKEMLETSRARGREALRHARRVAPQEKRRQQEAAAIILIGLSLFAFLFVLPVWIQLAKDSELSLWTHLACFVFALIVTLIGAGGATFVLLRRAKAIRRRWLERWEPRFAALAEQLGAPRVGSDAELLAWSEQWWGDRLSPAWVSGSTTHLALSFVAGGLPATISADIETDASAWLRSVSAPHVALLLAARLPRDTAYWAQTEAASRARGELERRGFTVELRTGGVAVQATARTIAQLRENPDAVAMLAPVAFILARFAHHLRASAPRSG